MIFQDKNILLGISGGIAAYKSILLLRALQKEGATVKVVMTEAACQMIGTQTLVALSGSQVPVKAIDTQSDSWFQHIDLARWADLYIVAPASANTLGVLAHGLTPNALGLIWLAHAGKKMVIPSMNSVMLQAPATQDNLNTLQRHGVHIVPPDDGQMACGEVGPGRYPETETILNAIEECLYPPATKEKILISAGRTEEAIDPVRYISNRASGQTALEIARVFRQNGHPVAMVCGPLDIELPSWIEAVHVKSSLRMFEAVQQAFRDAGVLIMNAAVADYRPAVVAQEKMKGSRANPSIELTPNPDILKEMGQIKKPHQKTIGFALETEKPIEYALKKLQSKGCDLICVNLPVDKTNGGFLPGQRPFAILNKNSEADTPLLTGTRREIAIALYEAYAKGDF